MDIPHAGHESVAGVIGEDDLVGGGMELPKNDGLRNKPQHGCTCLGMSLIWNYTKKFSLTSLKTYSFSNNKAKSLRPNN